MGGTSTSPSPALADQRQHLLDEERVAVRRGEDPGADVVVERRTVEQPVDQPLALVRRERLEQHRGRVELAAAPARPSVEQVGPGEAEEEDRGVAGEVGDVLDEVEQRRLAHCRSSSTTTSGSPRRRPRAASAPTRRRSRGDAGCSASPSSRAARPRRPRRGEVRRARRRGRAEQLLEDLDDRPVGDPLAVGKARPRRRARLRAAPGTPPQAATCRHRPRRGP